MTRTRVPRMILGLTWRDHIGGRWAISVRGFLLLLPILVVSPLANIQAVTLRNVGLWLAASVITLAPLILTWWLASATVLRHRRERPAHVAVVVLVGFISGALRAGAMTWVTVEFDLFSSQVTFGQLIVVRMLIGGAQGAIGLPVIAMLLSVISSYRIERARLLSQAAALAQRQDEERGATEALRDALAGPVRLRLQQLADRLESHSTSIDAVAGDVRQQAHTMWSTAATTPPPPRVRLTEVLRTALHNRPLPVVAVWLVWLPSAFLTFALRETLPVAVTQVVVGSIILSAIYLGGTALVRQSPNVGVPVFIVGTVSGAVVSGYVVWLLSGASNWDNDAVLFLTSIPWLVAVTLIVSVVESAVVRSGQVLEAIRDGIKDGEVELLEQQRVRSELAYEVATVLHGIVQGRLAVAQRSATHATALARGALNTGIERLTESPATATRSAKDVVIEVVAPWTALLLVNLDVADELMSALQARDLGDVIEECLSNAFRHGAATHVDIAVRTEADACVIWVVDDGSGLSGRVGAGLGSSLFDAVSGGDWSRVARPDGGCLVTVRLHYSDQTG